VEGGVAVMATAGRCGTREAAWIFCNRLCVKLAKLKLLRGHRALLSVICAPLAPATPSRTLILLKNSFLTADSRVLADVARYCLFAGVRHRVP